MSNPTDTSAAVPAVFTIDLRLDDWQARAIERLATLPTFSDLPRRFKCELTDVLPERKGWSPASLAGDARHAFFQKIAELLQPVDTGEAGRPAYTLELARELALTEADPFARKALEAIPLDALERLDLAHVAPEVALAYDVQTGECRELGRDLGRRYDEAGRRPTEIVGATDRLILIGQDGIGVGDYKGRSHRTPPSEDPQFLAAALVGSRVHGRRWAEIEVIREIDGELFHRRELVDQVALDRFELELQDLAARIRENVAAYVESHGLDLPPATEGDHCTYCARFAYCPAKNAIARAVIGGDHEELLRVVKEGAALITPENAGMLRRLYSEGKKRLEELGEALQTYARQTPFRLEDGRMYGVVPDAEERELGDGDLVRQVVAEVLEDAKAAELVVKKDAAFGRIDAAIKAHLGDRIQRGDLKTWNEKIEAKLTERGLLRVTRGGKIAAYVPAEEKAKKEPKPPKSPKVAKAEKPTRKTKEKATP